MCQSKGRPLLTRVPSSKAEKEAFAEEFKAAWFKDPDGNILHINNQ
jgi:hypothetical protein